ncbi:MAG: hypothetical protein IT258_09040, partial [Saprospiraceae bacterium]|nr:hypothetical protein [Saprospiraceae bacterium]
HHTERMTEDLGLSPEQAAKVKDINLKYAEKAKAKHDAKAADKAKNKSEREALRNEHDAELKKVLTKEQAAKFEQRKAERGDRKGKGGPGKHGKGGPDIDPAKRAEHQTERMTKDLGLNADQAAKVKAINEEFAQKAKALHDANKGDRAKNQAAHDALRKDHDAALTKVLTKEQAAKWEQHKAERQGEKGKGGPGKQKGKRGQQDLPKE